MKRVLPLFVMVDACGWELIQEDTFGQAFAPHRKKLRSVFGFSSACIPSILSGCWPEEHHNWCYFVHDPRHSPFRRLQWLRWAPQWLTGRRAVRRALSRAVKRWLGFRGYFDLYNIPLEHIGLYDFSEKKSPLKPGGLNRGANIFDFLEKRHVGYFGSDPDASEEQNKAALRQAIVSEQADFAFVYWPGLDGLLHQVGNESPEVFRKLRQYEVWIEELLAAAEAHYEETRLYVFSDHGMANCDRHLDLEARLAPLGLKIGVDYAPVYDSTMARFWFLRPGAREKVTACLEEVKEGRILSEADLKALHVWFPDHYFGELIFLAREGVLIVPSYMGARPIRAMHGYHPDERHSYAVLMTNQFELPEEVAALPDLFRLMAREAENAAADNHPRWARPEEPAALVRLDRQPA